VKEDATAAEMNPVKPIAIICALCAAATLLFGCGSDDKERTLLSQRSATRLDATLDRVSQLARDGDCTGAKAQVTTLQGQIAALPPRTGSSLRDALTRSAERLQSLIARSCKPAEPTVEPEPAVTAPPVTEQQPQDKKAKKPKKSKPKDEQPPPDETGGGGTGVGTGTGTGTVPNDQTNSGGATP
jgi:hypothetical protein